ncbi:MAG TPA: hypothetical protein VF668_00650 [Pyrinomonadaceae bacterium]|jgi:hypothetical protein
MTAMLTAEAAKFRAAEEIFALVRRFNDCTLPRAEWTHAAHLTVALWHLLEYDWPEAVGRVRRGIRRYNAALGAEAEPARAYHETLTLFWMRVVRAHLDSGRNEARSLVSLANEMVATHDAGLPLRHYTRALLFSPEARASWVAPDLRPLGPDDFDARGRVA